MSPLRIVAPAILAIVALSGCSGAQSAPEASPTPTPEPRPVPAEASTPEPFDPVAVYVQAAMAGMSVEEKAASLLMLHRPGLDPAPIRADIEQYGLGGVILMGDNVPADPASLRALTDGLEVDPDLPPLVAIDEEGGIVRRLPWDVAAGPDILKGQPVEATTEAFDVRAGLLDDAGVSVNFGIVADVTADSGSFIYPRVLGTDPAAAGERVAAAVGAEQGRVYSTLKHFPGHGAAPGDSHTSIPQTDLAFADWEARDAVPFREGIDAGAELVMFGHLRFTAVDDAPATMSAEWIDVLRDDLGFDGVAITDDMLMLQRSGDAEFADPVENAVRALEAGQDLLLYVLPADPSTVGVDVDALIAGIAAAVESGRIDQDSLDESVARVLTLRRSLAVDAG
ncbi:glycoside hydrolase family 3 N-terminal domain-containing protein [Agromyces mangrovi Wang et al. 2018]|uniref:glycoside hydrolase family 3 N-terminal domain-containing protein n=1 Tax=Agromyces mangrovi TaxID=1858653 RepID=UPI0025745154|nr:glycoside hydrolase family 3 N-terminal domain-containing protein [Agromyces mangrovi]BDZ66414.1 beta-N-acetylhexosaminidase [Agromyces mangrovi]